MCKFFVERNKVLDVDVAVVLLHEDISVNLISDRVLVMGGQTTSCE